MTKVLSVDGFSEVAEKLNIQPITKERLGNVLVRYKSASEMCENFKTGDVVAFGTGNNDVKELNYLVYVSYDDYGSFPKSESEHLGSKDFLHKGCFVMITPGFGYDINNTTRLMDYDEYLNWLHSKVGSIVRVYRYPTLKGYWIGNKFYVDAFAKEFSTKNAYVVWERKSATNEKLNIQPISKERLGDINPLARIEEKMGWKKKLRSGDVVVTTGSLDTRNTIYVYVTIDDIEKYDYIRTLPYSTYLAAKQQKGKSEGVLLTCRKLRNHNEYMDSVMLGEFEDDRMMMPKSLNNNSLTVQAIYRHEKRQIQPFTFEYIKNVDILDLIVKFERIGQSV